MSIIILGTPRSGTSCIAGILHNLGIHMGYRLKCGDAWNPIGYYQDEDIEAILHKYLGDWQFPKWTTMQTSAEVKQWAQNRAEENRVWGVKSNRLVYYLQSFLEGAGPTKIILTKRNIEHSKASWQARSGDEPDPVINIAEAIPAALDACGVKPDLIVDYDHLVENPIFGVTKIARVCGVKVNVDAINIVRKDYRRFGNG